jgi:hypothetical protein
MVRSRRKELSHIVKVLSRSQNVPGSARRDDTQSSVEIPLAVVEFAGAWLVSIAHVAALRPQLIAHYSFELGLFAV